MQVNWKFLFLSLYFVIWRWFSKLRYLSSFFFQQLRDNYTSNINDPVSNRFFRFELWYLYGLSEFYFLEIVITCFSIYCVMKVDNLKSSVTKKIHIYLPNFFWRIYFMNSLIRIVLFLWRNEVIVVYVSHLSPLM